LPRGTLDLVLGGHTHRPVAQRIHGVPVIQAPPYGRGFTRLDLIYDPEAGAVVDAKFHAPTELCPPTDDVALECRPAPYEGRPVEMSAAVAAVIGPAVARALDQRQRPMGVQLSGPVTRAYGEASALGNLFADLLLAGVRGADVALMNGGGLRADLPAGELRFGALFEAMPFDNRIATLRLTVADLSDVIARNLSGEDGILSVAGVKATVTCEGGAVAVQLQRSDGRPLRPTTELLVVASDFLATGGSGVFTEAQQAPDRVEITDRLMRDVLAEQIRARRGPIDPPRLLVPSRPRIAFPGERPVACTGG
jgi:5'-nucleotidase